jgi:hypothetical protein
MSVIWPFVALAAAALILVAVVWLGLRSRP